MLGGMRSFVLAVTAALAWAALGSPAGAAPVAFVTHAFVTHAEFFSLETRADQFLDPQVYAQQAGAAAATGPQGIPHAAGLRAALMTDDPATPAYNAQGKPLGFTLGAWFGARGAVVYEPAAARPQVSLAFAGLVPSGVYTVFENHFDRTPVGFTPLDGSSRSTFTADAGGNAALALTLAAPLTHADAILLVYHSDGTAHGSERGQPGVTAHHQLIFRIP